MNKILGSGVSSIEESLDVDIIICDLFLSKSHSVVAYKNINDASFMIDFQLS